MASNTRSQLAAIDLFAGIGGLGLGATQAGADLRLSVEIDEVACVSLKANAHGRLSQVLLVDVTQLSGATLRREAGLSRSDPLIILGGAPCQPFSKAAYWTEAGDEAAYRRARARGVRGIQRPSPPATARADDRRTLVEHFARLVCETKADGFVFENVPALAHPRNRPILDGLLHGMHAAGHRTAVVRANAVAFGVPQRRERIFVLGSRSGAPEPPRPTHRTSDGRPTAADADLLPIPTAGQACAPFRFKRFFEPEEVVTGRWADHLRSVPPGWNYKAHTAWGGHPSPTFVTETRFWNFLLKLHPNQPAWTLAANPGPWTGPFHWDSRRLRVPELLALQGFPSSYEVVGTRRERVRQVGNAVPPPVAAHMTAAVLEALFQGFRQRRRSR